MSLGEWPALAAHVTFASTAKRAARKQRATPKTIRLADGNPGNLVCPQSIIGIDAFSGERPVGDGSKACIICNLTGESFNVCETFTWPTLV